MRTSSITDLSKKISELEDRIRRIEADLREPLEADFHEQAQQLSQQVMMKRLLEVERSNLQKAKLEFERLQQES